MQSGGKNPNKIFLFGTSSAGKTTISKWFIANGYTHISNDEYGPVGAIEFSKSLPNEYISREDLFEQGSTGVGKYMYEQSKNIPKVVYDDIGQYILKFDNDIYTVVIHAPLDDLVRNILSRKYTSPRGLNVYRQFAKLYTVATGDIVKISKVNKNDFIQALKDNFKSEFNSEQDLMKFANDIFSQLGIEDNETHWVGLRPKYTYDLIINTHGNSAEQIYQEIMASF